MKFSNVMAVFMVATLFNVQLIASSKSQEIAPLSDKHSLEKEKSERKRLIKAIIENKRVQRINKAMERARENALRHTSSSKRKLKVGLKKLWSDFEPDLGVKLFNLDAGDDSFVQLHYDLVVESSNKPNNFVRVDQWNFSLALEANDVIEEYGEEKLLDKGLDLLKVKQFIRLGAGKKAVFVKHRQIPDSELKKINEAEKDVSEIDRLLEEESDKDQKRVLKDTLEIKEFELEMAKLRARDKTKWGLFKQWPKTYWDLPLTCDRAKKKMEVGELVSMPVPMNIVAGLRNKIEKDGAYLEGRAQYFIHGEFTIDIVRLTDNKFKVVVIPLSKQGTDLGIVAGYDVELFQLDILGKEINESKRVDLIEFSKIHDRDGEMLLMDYEFDFNNPEACATYNEIASRVNFFKYPKRVAKTALDALSGNLKGKKIDEIFAVDFITANKLAKEGNKGITVKNNDFIEFERSERLRKFSLYLARYQRKKTFMKNFIDIIGEDQEEQNYLFMNYATRKEGKLTLGVGSWKGFEYKSLYLLFETEPDHTDLNLDDFGVRFEQKDRVLRVSEQKKMIKLMRANLPEDLFDGSFDWKSWNYDNVENLTEKRNTRVSFVTAVNANALGSIRNKSVRDIKTSLEEYMVEKKLGLLPTLPGAKSRMINNLANALSAEPVAKGLITEIDQADKFMKLRNNLAFSKYGLGALFHLIGTQEQRNENITYKLSLSASNAETLEINTLNQDPAKRKLLGHLDYVELFLNHRSYDLRKIALEESLY